MPRSRRQRRSIPPTSAGVLVVNSLTMAETCNEPLRTRTQLIPRNRVNFGAAAVRFGTWALPQPSPRVGLALVQHHVVEVVVGDHLKKRGGNGPILEYPDAYHQFDAPVYRTAVKVEQGASFRRCRLEEGENGVVLNSETKQPFSLSDSCVEKGFTGGYYQEAAANKSHEDVKAFVKDLFKLQ